MIRSIQVLLLLAVWGAPALAVQEPRAPDGTAPPPLKTISRQERAQLDEIKDSKSRVRTNIELAEAHLTKAEGQTAQRDYDGAAAGAGRYWALIDDVFVFMKTMKRDSNKTRDLYKRIELTLRAHAPRLSAIRRSTPLEYAVWIKEIEELARKGRTEALNSFYGHTVVHDQQPSKKQGIKPAP